MWAALRISRMLMLAAALAACQARLPAANPLPLAAEATLATPSPARGQPDGTSAGPQPGWTRYSLPGTGFSLAYPPTWQLELPKGLPSPPINPPYFSLIALAPSLPGGNVIRVFYTGYGISPSTGDSLWGAVEFYGSLQQHEEPGSTVLSLTSSVLETRDGARREVVHAVRQDPFGIHETFYLAQGQLILAFSGYTTAETAPVMAAAIETLLPTVQIAPDAPRTAYELYGKNLERFRQTSPPPSLAEATPAPDVRRATARPAPTPPAGLAAARSASLPFRGTPGADFQVFYPPQTWQRQGDWLLHQQLAGCTLLVGRYALEVAGPRVVEPVELGHREWRRTRFPAEHQVAYALGTPRADYGFELQVLPSFSPSQELACQAAAEDVVKTFTLLNGP